MSSNFRNFQVLASRDTYSAVQSAPTAGFIKLTPGRLSKSRCCPLLTELVSRSENMSPLLQKLGTGVWDTWPKKHQTRSATPRRDRCLRKRQNPCWNDCARILYVVCVPFVFRPTSLRGKEYCCERPDGVGKALCARRR